jgi:Mg-chelatase subunit ChlD
MTLFSSSSFFPEPLIGLAWGNPWLLLWAAGLAIPILIHLWNRNRYQQMDWAAMRFLLQAVKQNARRITLQQLILLAVRAVIFILLALALAHPLLNRSAGSQNAEESNESTHYIFVIDGSYSMELRGGSQSLFEQAKSLIRKQLEQAIVGDGFSLILLADPAESIIHDPAFAVENVELELLSLKTTFQTADLESGLREADSILRSSQQSEAIFSKRRLLFYTDLGENTWNSVTQPSVKRLIADLSTKAQLEVREMTAPDRSNVAIVDLQQSPARVAVGETTQIVAQVAADAGGEDQDITLELIVNGESRESKSIQVPAGATRTVRFPVKFPYPGNHRVNVRSKPDLLPVDDQRFLIASVFEKTRVLAVAGQPHATQRLGWALQPGAVSDAGNGIEVDQISFASLAEKNLDAYDAIFLCNVPGFETGEVQRLLQFLQTGGGIVIGMGDAVKIDNYNRQLFDQPQQRLLPGKLIESAAYGDYRIDPRDYTHPIIEPFRGVGQSGLLSIPVWKYLRLESPPLPTAKIALAFHNGDPLIVTFPAASGRVAVFTSALSGKSFDQVQGQRLPWTEIQTSPSYVVLVHEMLRYVMAGRNSQRNLLVGDPLRGFVNPSMQNQQLELRGPRDETIPVIRSRNAVSTSAPLDSQGAPESWSGGIASQIGFYELRQNDENAVERFAVNLDTRESDLTRLPLDALPIQFQNTDNRPAVPVDISPKDRSHLFQYLLIGLLGLVICESGLAWLFGRQFG